MGQGVSKGAFVLGTLGLGAGLMYLLDPDRGQQRRARGLHRAMRYRDLASEAIDSASHVFNRRAHGLTRGVGRHTQRFSRQAGGLMRGLGGRLGQSSAPLRLGRAGAYSSNTSPAWVLLGGLALGAGLMYLFDPVLGNQRRQTGRHTARSYWQKTGRALNTTRRTLGEKAREFVPESRTQEARNQNQSEASSRQS